MSRIIYEYPKNYNHLSDWSSGTLKISLEENSKRISNPERALRLKSLSVDEEHLQSLIHIEDPNLLDLDVTHLSAAEAASKILQFIDDGNQAWALLDN